MDEVLFKKIAEEVEREWSSGGLSDGMYYDYALEIAKRYFSVTPSTVDKSNDQAYVCSECGYNWG